MRPRTRDPYRWVVLVLAVAATTVTVRAVRGYVAQRPPKLSVEGIERRLNAALPRGSSVTAVDRYLKGSPFGEEAPVSRWPLDRVTHLLRASMPDPNSGFLRSGSFEMDFYFDAKGKLATTTVEEQRTGL